MRKPPERTAVFRTDASVGIGAGHVMRCAVLADTLAERGWRSVFASRGAPPSFAVSAHETFDLRCSPQSEAAAIAGAFNDGVDLLAVDHYQRGQEFESACRPWARRIMAIDDLPNRPHDVDILLDQTLGRNAGAYRHLVGETCVLLTGARFALLRPQFAAAREASLERRRQSNGLKRILIQMGATDPENVTMTALDAVDAAVTVDVILASSAPHLDEVRRKAEAGGPRVNLHVDCVEPASLMAEADLAIGAPGSASWERCCLGLPALMITFAENQVDIAKAIHGKGAGEGLGWHTKVGAEQLTARIGELRRNPGLLLKISDACATICDGFGASRTADKIEEAVLQ